MMPLRSLVPERALAILERARGGRAIQNTIANIGLAGFPIVRQGGTMRMQSRCNRRVIAIQEKVFGPKTISKLGNVDRYFWVPCSTDEVTGAGGGVTLLSSGTGNPGEGFWGWSTSTRWRPLMSLGCGPLRQKGIMWRPNRYLPACP